MLKKSILVTLLLARVASAEEASLPWQLHAVGPGNVVEANSAVAVFRDPQGNVDIAETTALSASYQLDDRWAPMIRLGFVGNNAPGAARDGASVGNPIVGATYTRERLALFAAMAIPVGSGDEPEARIANAASMTARPSDEAMFEVDHATAIIGADVVYRKHGFTAQAEASLLQSVRVRGDDADTFRTRATMGGHLGVFLGSHVSIGADVEYRRWLASPTMTTDLDTLTASIGARVHVRVGKTTIHPGLSYTRGLDGLALHGPTDITKQTNAVAISIPVMF